MSRSAHPALPVALAAAASLLLGVIGTGCNTISVKTDAAPGVDFTAFKTFSQAAPPREVANLPGYSEITGDHINVSIAQELEAKGLSLAPEGKADLLVAFSVDGQPRQDIVSNGGYGWYGYWGGNTYTVQYTLGTLTIDIFDARQKKLIWHAYGQTNLYGQQSSDKQVDKAVKSIMEKFPPTPAK